MRTVAVALLLLPLALISGCDCWYCYDDCGCYDCGGCYDCYDCYDCGGCAYVYFYQSLSPEEVIEEHDALVEQRDSVIANGGDPEQLKELEARIEFLEKSWTPTP
jgi:hypothetical protein